MSRGRASCRCPQTAKSPMLLRAQEGRKTVRWTVFRWEPSPGVPKCKAHRLTGVEHITVSLVALFRIASHSFLKGVSLPANSCIATRKIRRHKLFDLPNREFFVLTKSEERRNTAVFQVKRQKLNAISEGLLSFLKRP